VGTNEAEVFRGGSGSGANISRLREDGAPLSGEELHQVHSLLCAGPMLALELSSLVGCTTRGQMVIMDIDHPDVEEFIECKAREERKIRVLRDAGFEVDFDGKDTHTLGFRTRIILAA